MKIGKLQQLIYLSKNMPLENNQVITITHSMIIEMLDVSFICTLTEQQI